MTVKKPDPMLSVADVAKMLGVSNMTIYRLVHTDVIPGYRVLWVVAVMVGSVVSLPAVWSFADVANGLMAIPNLVSLVAQFGGWHGPWIAP